MGLMALNYRKPEPVKKPLVTKKTIIIAIAVLVILNLAFLIFLYFNLKASANSFSASADNVARNQNLGNLLGTNLPKEDVAGEEIVLPDGVTLSRYKDSKRTAFEKQESKVIVSYQTKDSSVLVLNFFKSLLAGNDWVLISDEQSAVSFAKGSSSVKIETDQDIEEKITTINIQLIK